MDAWPDYTAVTVIGLAVGAAETLTRHRGRSFDVLWSWWSAVYILLNAAISLVALFGIRRLGWDFGLDDGSPERWAQVSAAGFGAMTLLRSSVVLAREESGNDIGIGPAGIVQIVLDRIDHAIATERIEEVARQARELMADVDYEKAHKDLPVQCANLLLADTGGAPGEEDMARIGRTVGRWASLPEQARKVNLGIFLIDEFGEKIVRLAKQDLMKAIGNASPEG
ncbi:MAG: hypothetical protein HY875_10065 [Chloroflexi bacterium]|nr:hypothetical protein [Chloroflexota bacterium]